MTPRLGCFVNLARSYEWCQISRPSFVRASPESSVFDIEELVQAFRTRDRLVVRTHGHNGTQRTIFPLPKKASTNLALAFSMCGNPGHSSSNRVVQCHWSNHFYLPAVVSRSCTNPVRRGALSLAIKDVDRPKYRPSPVGWRLLASRTLLGAIDEIPFRHHCTLRRPLPLLGKNLPCRTSSP